MAEDISNKTIVVLVVLTVLISILGTAVVWDSVAKIKMESSKPKLSGDNPRTGGEVSFRVLPEQEPVEGTGYVAFTILPKGE
jgi:hypothetical protein